jgi:release factor H-coupled RctB family protein
MSVKIITAPDVRIEGEAIRQLEATAKRPDMLRVAAYPDVHPAKGSPNGAAFLSSILYPDLIGNDSGCGMGLWVTSLDAHRASPDKIAKSLNGLDKPWDGDPLAWLQERGIEPTGFDNTLGTPGHGNHFIEVQQVYGIFDQAAFDNLGMDKSKVHVTVHTGSRGYGESILRQYATQKGAEGVPADSPMGQRYLADHAHAVSWAVANRELCAHRVFEATGSHGTALLDICHNSVVAAVASDCQCWLHRKGAAPADKGPVIIPGSRGDLSYVVQPIASDEALWSVAHGAGRKIARGEAQAHLREYYRNRDPKRNQFGGKLVCGDKPLLFEEAPECYKPIQNVVACLEAHGLIKIIATLKPSLATFKTSEETEKKFNDRRRDIERRKARQEKRR